MTIQRIAIRSALLLGLLCVSGPAQATEVSLDTGVQRLPYQDSSFLLPPDGISLVALRLSHPLRFKHLAWTAGAEYGRTTNTMWEETSWEEDVYGDAWIDGSLDLLALDAGVRWSVPLVNRIVPYASLSLKGYVGHVRLEDPMTGWAYWADEDQEAPDYTVKPVRRFGVSGGGQAMVGVRWMLVLPRKAPEPSTAGKEAEQAPEVTAARAGNTALDAPVAEVGSSPAREAAPSPEAGTVSGEADTAGEPSVEETGESGEAAADTAVEAKPVPPPLPVWGEKPPAHNPDPVVHRRPPRPPKPRNWSLGVDTSAGYTLSAPLALADIGDVSLTGLRFRVGLMFVF